MRFFIKLIFLFINLLNSIISIVPIWNFYDSAIDLLSNNDKTHEFFTYGENCKIKKIIKKDTDGSIKYEKYLYYNENQQGNVNYENGNYFDSTVFSSDKLICPRGKFHPHNLLSGVDIKNDEFIENGDWDLKCFNHQNGCFLIFYLNNKNSNFFLIKKDVSLKEVGKTYYGKELYDFKLEDGTQSKSDQKFKFSLIYWDNNGYLTLRGAGLIMNSYENFINKDDLFGTTKKLIQAKQFSHAYFTNDSKFIYFTYNDVSDFLGGYSTSSILNNDGSIIVNVENIAIKNHNFSPIEFLNEVEIKKIKLISGTRYAYYEIYDKNDRKTYHGLIDIKENKVLFNTDEEISTFVPYSNSEMLAITPNSAYKICIFKNSDETCSETCSGGNNLILDVEGNKCKADNICDGGKIKLMMNEICIDESLCDLNIYVKNNTHCGLCKELYPNTPYKLLNTLGCLDFIPNNSIQYNSNSYLKIYKCKPLFHPYNNNLCIPDYCFPNCQDCYEASNDTNNQKCLSCKPGYYIDGENCLPCENQRCEICTKESNNKALCTKCKSEYKTVNITTINPEFFHCYEEKEISDKFFYDEDKDVYKPCYRKCKRCNKEGNDDANNCLECNTGYMFRPLDNQKNNCISKNLNIYLDAYGNIKNLKNSQCPEDALYKIINNKTKEYKVLCIYDCKESIDHLYLYNGICMESCPPNTKNVSFVCQVNDPNQCSYGENEIHLEGNDDMKVVETLAKSYTSEFRYTTNYISRHYNKNFSIIIYKNASCIKEQSLMMPTIDFQNCSKLIKKIYNVTELVAAVADRKLKANPTSFYGFYHPISGIKLDAERLCNNSEVKIKENLLVLLEESDEYYSLQILLTQQGINIFDENSKFYSDICFEYDNPLSRDIPLKDRQKYVFPNAKLCDDGCQFEGMDYIEMTATCNCKFREISQSNLEPIIEDIFGDAFELISASNLEVLRCYKNFFNNLGKSIGGIIIIILIIADITFSVLFILYELTKLKRYILTLTDNYLLYLKQTSKTKANNPPKKFSEDTNYTDLKLLNMRNSQKKDILIDKSGKNNSLLNSKEQIVIYKNKENKNDLIQETKSKIKKKKYKKKKKVVEIPTAKDNFEAKNKKFFEEYLESSVDDLEYDDAIGVDDRSFMEMFCDILKEKQLIMNIFFANDPLKTRFIRYIFFILDICLYLIVNGFFFGEEYLSMLFNLEEEDNFFSFFPRSIDKLIYTTIVTMVIAYITDFFFIEEKKIIGMFKREKENKKIIKQYIVLFIKDLQNRYISFIIMVFVILIFSFYYLVCFNRVYPKTQIEWLKSSIVIMIIIQIISVLKCLFETSIRTLSFRVKNERLYKLSKIFD